jgi:hypothetical protein
MDVLGCRLYIGVAIDGTIYNGGRYLGRGADFF